MGKYNLRTILIAFFVLQVAVTTVTVSYLALRNEQQAVNTSVSNLLSEILHHDLGKCSVNHARSFYTTFAFFSSLISAPL